HRHRAGGTRHARGRARAYPHGPLHLLRRRAPPVGRSDDDARRRDRSRPHVRAEAGRPDRRGRRAESPRARRGGRTQHEARGSRRGAADPRWGAAEAPRAGRPRLVLRARALAERPCPRQAGKHGCDRARARGTHWEASMSRAKLRSLGLDLPILPTSTVGSFPKPDYLVEARAKATRNAITRPELDRLEHPATEFWVRTQEELGLDGLVDGGQYRGDMVAYFAETMPGFAKGGLVRSYGNRYYHKPVMVGPVRWPGPMTVDWWRWTQSLTTRPVKGMLTG